MLYISGGLNACETPLQVPFNTKQNNERRKWHTWKYCLLVSLFIKWTSVYEFISGGTTTSHHPYPNLPFNANTHTHTHTHALIHTHTHTQTHTIFTRNLVVRRNFNALESKNTLLERLKKVLIIGCVNLHHCVEVRAQIKAIYIFSDFVEFNARKLGKCTTNIFEFFFLQIFRIFVFTSW